MNQYFYEQRLMHRCRNYNNRNDNNNNNNNNKMVMITIKTTIIVGHGNYYTSNSNNTCIDNESALRHLQAIYNSKCMSRTELFRLSYQVLFKYAQISSKNLI